MCAVIYRLTDEPFHQGAMWSIIVVTPCVSSAPDLFCPLCKYISKVWSKSVGNPSNISRCDRTFNFLLLLNSSFYQRICDTNKYKRLLLERTKIIANLFFMFWKFYYHVLSLLSLRPLIFYFSSNLEVTKRFFSGLYNSLKD